MRAKVISDVLRDLRQFIPTPAAAGEVNCRSGAMTSLFINPTGQQQMRIQVSSALRTIRVLALLSVTTTCGEHHATGVSPSSPTLLQCPSTGTSTTSALVTTLGATVSLAGTSITIPAGALAAATTITLTVPASQYMEIAVTANSLTSFVFQQSVSITIDYSRCSAAEASKSPLTVWHIDPQTKQLLENMGGVDDKTNHHITFTTGHLSGYALAF